MMLKKGRAVLPFKFYNLHLESPTVELTVKGTFLTKNFPLSGAVNNLELGCAQELIFGICNIS